MNTAISQILEKHFKESDTPDSEKVFNQLSFYIYSMDADQNDLYILAKILSPEDLQKLITYYDGKHIKIPTNEKYEECLLVSLCFYLKEIKGWDWPEIKKFMGLPEKHKKHISTISLGGKINKIKDKLNNDLKTLFDILPSDLKTSVNTLSIKDFHELFTKKLGKTFCKESYEEMDDE